MRHSMTAMALSLGLSAAGVGAACPAFAAPAYEMIAVAPPAGGDPTFFRIDVATGQVMSFVGTQFAPTTDAAPLPQGDYHLHMTEPADEKSYWLERMDSQSGRTWFLINGAWSEVMMPK